MSALTDLFERYNHSPNFCNGPIADVHHKGIFGNTPLHIAAINDEPESAQILIDAGADIHALGEDGLTPLLAALELGNMKAAAFLRSKE